MKKKIAIVVQRYGVEVNGGAEFHARILSEKLSLDNEVEIITTTAIDYCQWENYYSEGTENINGLKVHRFSTINKKSRKTRISRRAILQRKKYFKLLKFFRIFNLINKYFNISKINNRHVENWIVGQGPYSPDLIKFIEANKYHYDIFIFFTYLFYPTVKGMPIAAERSIFIPTAHDEPLLYTKPYEELFSVPKFIMYNTDSEKQLVENNFKNVTQNCDIAGVGIDKYQGKDGDLPEYIEAKKYFIYIGRIDVAKGCKQMIENYLSFIEKHQEYKGFKLVLVGKNFMKNYTDTSIVYVGFIDENLKYTLLKNSVAMVMPSFYESLSLVTLEAMKERIPVIVNQKCEVLYNHILKSGSGCYYNSSRDFNEALQKYIHLSPEKLEEEGAKAENYVNENYKWEKILQKFDKAFNFIIHS